VRPGRQGLALLCGPSTSPLAAMTTSWYSTWLRPLAFVAVLFAVFAALSGPEARFESSDGIWHDGTDHLKGRSFGTVQFDFDQYRQLCIRPGVTLVRNTKMEWWNPLFWYYYVSRPEWRTPWAPQRTCLKKRCFTDGFPDCTGSAVIRCLRCRTYSKRHDS
jgi:hypothetical protein